MVGEDPYELLAQWMMDAERAEPRVPDAMQLATVGADGRPSLRTVLVKGFGPDGLVFYTHLESRKATEIAGNPRVAGLLHWKALERQVIVEGRAELLPRSICDAYFATRPRGSQLGAWASLQSQARHEGELEERLAEVCARFEGCEVSRPPTWGGFRIDPTRFEFWQGRPDRLHDRLVFEHAGEGWRTHRLHP